MEYIAEKLKSPGKFIKKVAKGGKELLGLDENTEEINFNMPLDLTGLLNFITPEK